MPLTYFVEASGRTVPMSRVSCSDELEELQLLLERNPDLLPGEQIDPDDPRRWLLIKREMPVPDPATGQARWSIDFLFADQDGIPTFVEVKRFGDTRSRREVVGQMLEYAANGHFYWDKIQLHSAADASATASGTDIGAAITALQPKDDLAADDYFDRVEQNLRQHQVRLVFFLDSAPFELRSIVDFLNNQMQKAEVLIVEARLHEINGVRVVTPTLFGYSEQARMVKRPVTVSPATGPRRKWDRQSFLEEVARRLGSARSATMERVLNDITSLGCEVSWGTGKERGSFSPKFQQVSQKSLLTFYTDGSLVLNFGWLDAPASASRARDLMRKLAEEKLGLITESDAAYPSFAFDDWSSRAEFLAPLLREVVTTASG